MKRKKDSNEAAVFLGLTLFRQGPTPATKMVAAGLVEGYTESQIKTGKKIAGIRSAHVLTNEGKPGRWWWLLPV